MFCFFISENFKKLLLYSYLMLHFLLNCSSFIPADDSFSEKYSLCSICFGNIFIFNQSSINKKTPYHL